MEGVAGVVGAAPVGAPGQPRAEDVVEDEQVGVAEPLGGLGEVTHQHRVVTDLGLREHHTGAHPRASPSRR